MINIIGNIILSATSAAAAVVSRIVPDGLKMWLGFSKSIIASEDLVNSDYTVTFENFQDRANLTISSNSISATPESGVYRIARNKLSQPSMEVGSSYLVSFNYTRTAGTLEFKTNVTEITVNSGSSGSISEVIVAGNTRYNFTFSPTSNITVTDISVKEVAQFAPDILGVTNQELGQEEVDNGDFAQGILNWDTAYSNTTISVNNNVLRATANASGAYGVQQELSLNNGDTYQVQATINLDNASGGAANFRISENSSLAAPQETLFTSSGTYTATFTATSDTMYIGVVDTAIDSNNYVEMTSVSVKEVLQAYEEPNNAKLYTGKALSFDGVNDYVDFGSDINNSGAVWTVAFWISNYTNVGSNYNWIIGENTTRNIGLRNQNGTNKVFYRASGATYYDFDTIAFKDSFTTAKRFVMSSDGTDISLYLDGQFIDTVTPTTSTELKVSRFMAGYNATQFLVNATTSDFQLWDTAWTQADATFDYNYPNHLVTDNSSTSIALSNLKGYWALSEGSGSIAYDSSGEGNNGAINGAAYVTAQPRIPQLGMKDWSKGSNLLKHSEGFNDSVWNKVGNTSIDFNVETSPIGDTTASRVNNLLGASGIRLQQTFTISDIDGKTYLGSMYFKGEGSNIGNTITLQAKRGSGAPLVVANTEVTLTNEWQRVNTPYFTGQSTHSGVILALLNASDTATSCLIWGAQLEESTTLGNYIATTTSNATDVTLISNPNNPSKDILDNTVRLREHSFNLDGTGYAQIADDDSLDFGTGAFSIDGWVKFKRVGAGSLNCIYTNGGQIDVANTFGVGTGSNQIMCRVSSTALNSTTTFVEDDWVYFALTRDGSGSCKLYINGNTTPEATATQAANVTSSDNKLIGRDSSSVRYYHNLIDDIRLYNRELSANETKQNYNAGKSAHKVGSSFSDDFSSDYGF